jgi:hypothetical protein
MVNTHLTKEDLVTAALQAGQISLIEALRILQSGYLTGMMRLENILSKHNKKNNKLKLLI